MYQDDGGQDIDIAMYQDDGGQGSDIAMYQDDGGQGRDIAMYQDDCGQGHLYLIGATILRWHMRHFIRAYETVIYS